MSKSTDAPERYPGCNSKDTDELLVYTSSTDISDMDYLRPKPDEKVLFIHRRFPSTVALKADYVEWLLRQEKSRTFKNVVDQDYDFRPLQKRLVALIPQLSDEQKQWLAEAISDKALATVRKHDPASAEMIAALRPGIEALATGKRSGLLFRIRNTWSPSR